MRFQYFVKSKTILLSQVLAKVLFSTVAVASRPHRDYHGRIVSIFSDHTSRVRKPASVQTRQCSSLATVVTFNPSTLSTPAVPAHRKLVPRRQGS